MKQVIIVGGGIIGLSCAYYLRRSGWQVTVLDRGDFQDNCSFGNAGYVCPSHFIPLATPGIVRQGLKWMLNAKSPFYVQPRWNWGLFDWGLKFMRSATPDQVERAAIPLRDIALISQHEYEAWNQMPGWDFAYEHKGLLELFQTEEKADHARHIVAQAKELGLDSALLNYEELQLLEPETKMQALGAIHFKCDSHLYPNRLMQVLSDSLKQSGVPLLDHQQVNGFRTEGARVTGVVTTDREFLAEEVVIAAGAWSREVARMADARIPLMPGRGYSITLENSPYRLHHPAVLVEGRVALTPMDGNKMRFGGTMELTSTQTPPKMARVEGILKAVRRFFPDFNIALPDKDKIWYGFRPCSADGLPYIGRLRSYPNVTLATGHSMLGLSLGAGTGKLVDELINGRKPSMDLRPFAVDRFQ